MFCIRIGDSNKPWFRYVPVDQDWALTHDEEGHPRISTDTLISLRVADPGNERTPRWLDTLVYDRAFDAWEAARSDAHITWSQLTEPNALQPDMPLSFRDARQLVFSAGGYLGREKQIDLANRLGSVPSAKVARQMRRALNEGRTDEERLGLVAEVLETAGITAPPPREPLPDVELHEVRLVAWMAVCGT